MDILFRDGQVFFYTIGEIITSTVIENDVSNSLHSVTGSYNLVMN
jgi:hypothetical protein